MYYYQTAKRISAGIVGRRLSNAMREIRLGGKRNVIVRLLLTRVRRFFFITKWCGTLSGSECRVTCQACGDECLLFVGKERDGYET